MYCDTTKADQALSVCLERGKKALCFLESQQVTEALALLKKRKMAFCNFRYYAAGQDVSKLHMEDVLRQDHLLQVALSQVIGDLKTQRLELSKGKAHIRKFQSSSQNPSGFQRSI